MVLVVLVCLLYIVLVLVHTFLQVSLILQITGLITQLLHIRQDDHFKVKVVLASSLPLIDLFRDEGRVPVPRIGAIVARMWLLLSIGAGGGVGSLMGGLVALRFGWLLSCPY